MSETEANRTEAQEDKRPKKKIRPAEAPAKSKIKKSSSLIKRFKLKGKGNVGAEGFRDSEVCEEVQTATTSRSEEHEPEQEQERNPTERQTPEGDDSAPIEKAASETNLTETSWKSAENLVKEDNAKSSSVVNVQSTEYRVSVGDLEKNSGVQKTKSLENFKLMPAYGELILDQKMTNSKQSEPKRRDHLYKILVIGDLGAGKTSIIKRYVHSFFSQHYRATIGVDFALKSIDWDPYTSIRLQLWDIAGQERYGSMTRVYYKEAVGAFIVFDVTRMNTFESVAFWKEDLDSKVQLPDGSPIPCVLLANKCDQPKEGIVNNPAKMDDYCKEKGFVAWFETSAKENINIDEATRSLVTQILQNDSLINSDSNRDKDQITLSDDSNEQKRNKKCNC